MSDSSLSDPRSPLDDLRLLIELMEARLVDVRNSAKDNEFLDVTEAECLHVQLRTALQSWDTLDGEQRRILSEAVTYLVRADDEENDWQSLIGFEDDAEAVGRSPSPHQAAGRGKNGLGAPGHVTISSSRARLHAT